MKRRALVLIFLGLTGCVGNSGHVDLTNTPEVKQSAIIGERLTLKKDMLMAREPWEQYDDLLTPPFEPSPGVHYKITGQLSEGTPLVVVTAQHQTECDGFWHWGRETAIGRVMSRPYAGRLIVVGDAAGDLNWSMVADPAVFKAESLGTPGPE